jgi:hypothetical protein
MNKLSEYVVAGMLTGLLSNSIYELIRLRENKIKNVLEIKDIMKMTDEEFDDIDDTDEY